MKKLIVISALIGLVAAGCASKEKDRGGISDVSSPNYGNATSDIGTTNNTRSSDLQDTEQGKGANELKNDNNGPAGSSTAPGGTSSGNDSQGLQNPSSTDTNKPPQEDNSTSPQPSNPNPEPNP